ncbi:mycothiol synthase [Brachybacterium sp. DNPG3]
MITTDALSAAQRRGVDELLATAVAHDGETPLDEAARLALSGGDAQHLLVLAPPTDAVMGYASILPDGTVQGMVDPAHRRRGHGTALLEAALAARPDAGVWAHGALPEAIAMLTGRGLHETRRLLIMGRALVGPDARPLPAVRPSDLPGLELRTFDPARDAADWVALNAAAFAAHPEQGALTLADLERRMAEPWFEASDLLLARAGEGELVGFVWVKRESRGAAVVASETAATSETAEVYVVATSPAVQGRGVAGQLLGESLTRLAADGVAAVELYVEGDNTGAIALYERWGFATVGIHAQLRRSAEG